MNSPTKEKRQIHILIHTFAALHAVSTLVANGMGYNDEIVLTALTIGMVVLIATRFDFPLEVTFALTLLNCFAGFYLGKTGAPLVNELLEQNEVLGNVLSTFVITEFLGWITYLIVNGKREQGQKEKCEGGGEA